MPPNLKGIDHVHVYVADWAAAEAWYRRVLGFSRVEALMPWAVDNGPLTIENADGSIHLALFQTDRRPPISTVAFGATGEEFLAWKDHLEAAQLTLRVTDHRLAYSLYFSDPDGNTYEITTYDHEHVRARVA